MKRLFEQVVKFVGLSGIGWMLDFLVYTFLGFVSVNIVTNNILSSWVGVTFVFLFSTKTVFQNNSQISLKWKYMIYLIYQCVLIIFISKLLNGVNNWILANIGVNLIIKFSAIISKIVVTPITMILNFFVMKSIIEKI